MLPGIKIKFDNGNLGSVVSTADGVFGLLASSVAVADKFELNTPYVVKGMVDVANLGILPSIDNYNLYKSLKEFYEEAGEGTELWLMGMPKNQNVSVWFTPDPSTGKAPAEKLLDSANGKLTLLFTKAYWEDDVYPNGQELGLDEDVFETINKAQLLADNYTKKKFAPFIVLIEGLYFNYNHIELDDLNEYSNNRVAVFIGDTAKSADDPTGLGIYAANHILAGRLAKFKVHENAGKVKNGALATLTAFIKDTPAELYDVESLHDKGYITFRTHVRKSGYYISDDPLATAESDDYHYITRRRVIDKAYRLAHNIASTEILADFDLNNDGTISPFYAKTVEGNIEREIAAQMTANGELSANPNDKDDLGVRAIFDLTKNVSTTNRIELKLRVRPKGYARWFDINLGYDVTLNN